jgi:hypothetical protein
MVMAVTAQKAFIIVISEKKKLVDIYS